MTARIPLAGAADAMLNRLAAATGAPAIAALDGATLLGERAGLHGFVIPGRVSAGGGCRLFDARDGIVALNLARPADRELLPALFRNDALDAGNDAAIAAAIARHDASPLVMRAQAMGLAAANFPSRGKVASDGEDGGALPTVPHHAHPPSATPSPAPGGGGQPSSRPPRILDLSALWAGPLAAHLLWLAGADVIKVETPGRPDAMRGVQPDFHDLLNQGKASVALEMRGPEGRAALLDLIAGADIVIEASRPRALLQLGVDAAALLRADPALVWLSITAHGMDGDAADRIGFGDDVGIAAGLGAALRDATGAIGFVGDAIADPLAGIAAALAGHTAWKAGRGGRIGIAMVDVAAAALATERQRDPARFAADLQAWADAAGRAFPAVRRRAATPARPLGGDPPVWRPQC